MTRNKDFKRRVRDRQARTGESYMAAMRHVRDQAPAPTGIPVLELVELSPLAAELGLRCRVSIFPGVLEDVEPRALLTQLRDALERPDLEVLRAALLDGTPPAAPDYRTLVAPVHLDEGITYDGTIAQLWIGGRDRPVLVRFGLTVPPAFASRSLPMRLLIGGPTRWHLT